MQVKITCLHDEAILPAYATPGASAMDLHALIEPDFKKISPTTRYLNAGGTLIVRTGIAVQVPDGYGLFVLSRSGHGFKWDVSLANSVGLIDSDYTGEIMVKLRNDGREALQVKNGDRIAQCCILPMPRIEWVQVASLDATERGEAGLGSTGV